jgi:hypothetical protein
VFYLLDDLKELHLLDPMTRRDEKGRKPGGHRERLTGEHGTRIRQMNLLAFLGAGVQDSRAGVHSNVAHNRHLTDMGPVAGFEFESATGGKRFKSSSSLPDDDDDSSLRLPPWEPIERKIERLIEEARTALVRDGWPDTVVDAGLRWIEERSDFSGTVPASANYYIFSFNAAMADHRDKAKILKRATQRERVTGSLPELRRTADNLKRESQASGRPIKTILDERSRAPATSRSGAFH